MGCGVRFQSSLGMDVGISAIVLILIAEFSCAFMTRLRQSGRAPAESKDTGDRHDEADNNGGNG
jgi:hypothetical protein